jgi:hypothetical protein
VDDEAVVKAKRAEKRQKRTKKAINDTTAIANARSKQNELQIEQIIEF